MPKQPPTLRDMVNEARARDRSLTFRRLAARAVDPETGQRASFSLFSDLANNNVDRMPYDYHLRAIAVALGVPYERVRQAAIRQWVPAQAANTENTLVEEVRQLREDNARLTERTERLLKAAERGLDTEETPAGRESA